MSNKFQIYDAHHHLWDLNRCHYPWLEARGQKRFFGDPSPIQQDYLDGDLFADADSFEIVGSTHVQVGVAEMATISETRFAQEVADRTGKLCSAIVAFADLTSNELDAQLEEHAQSENFRGVRQIVGRHPEEDAQTGSNQILSNPQFGWGLSLLAAKGLRFDLQLIEQNYAEAAVLFSRIPDLKFAICHFGSPWDVSTEGFARWRAAMARFAEVPGAHMKFSGFGMFKPDWSPEDIAPYVETALELFGEVRCMVGSNFPVDKLYGGYDRIWNALLELVGSGSTWSKLSRENAQRFYRV
ncbi:MAG: amidohydrolase family protein [Erythrobacter sp.]|uniref:amidohydrolase family protein n=1 Tax=Erythrobacter sp. TaxID=1042 RepID=UPI003A85B513